MDRFLGAGCCPVGQKIGFAKARAHFGLNFDFDSPFDLLALGKGQGGQSFFGQSMLLQIFRAQALSGRLTGVLQELVFDALSVGRGLDR